MDYAEKAVKVVLAQYELGTVQITQLIQITQNLVLQQDTLAIAQGEIPAGLIQVYKALGGGWQIRINGCDLPPPPTASRQPIEQLQPPRLLPPTDLPEMKNGK